MVRDRPRDRNQRQKGREIGWVYDLDWLDTGTEAAFIGLKLPNGRYVMSSALTNA